MDRHQSLMTFICQFTNLEPKWWSTWGCCIKSPY